MPEPTRPLTSPQLQSLHSHYESQLRKVIESLNLRKWLVEKFGDKLKITDLESLHAFITSPSLPGLSPPKDESIAAHMELVEEYLELHPSADWNQAYEGRPLFRETP